MGHAEGTGACDMPYVKQQESTHQSCQTADENKFHMPNSKPEKSFTAGTSTRQKNEQEHKGSRKVQINKTIVLQPFPGPHLCCLILNQKSPAQSTGKLEQEHKGPRTNPNKKL